VSSNPQHAIASRMPRSCDTSDQHGLIYSHSKDAVFFPQREKIAEAQKEKSSWDCFCSRAVKLVSHTELITPPVTSTVAPTP